MTPQPAKIYLDLAARAAYRAAGDAEPNPLVGCVIVRDGRIIGVGHHKKFGGLHAEREALADCLRRGEDPRGAVVYVTLEPCCHFGKQPPCTAALIEAGVARVVAAGPDPNPVSGGGAAKLEAAGIPCEFNASSANALEVGEPFVRRIRTGLPWVIAKWAQTVDGRLITRADEPRWISGEVARRRVHRWRARVDAIITGIGTVLADDPLLTARGVARVRRLARRVVVDSHLRLSPLTQVARTAAQTPTTVVCLPAAATSVAAGPLTRLGVEIVACEGGERGIVPREVLRLLAERYSVASVMLECGPRLLASFFAAGLIDEAIVHIGSARLNEAGARASAERAFAALADRAAYRLCRARPLGGDTELIHRAHR